MAADSDTCILLVRHGETEETERTISQCSGSAVKRTRPQPGSSPCQDAAGGQLDAVFTSPSQRARETAAPLVTQRDLELHVIPELAEMGFGQLGGMSFAEAVPIFPEALKRWIENPFEVTLPEGEPFLDFVGRVRRVRRQLTREWSGHTIAVVTHGGVIAVWRCLEEGRPWSDFWRGIPAPGTGVWLIRAEGQVRVETLRPEV